MKKLIYLSVFATILFLAKTTNAQSPIAVQNGSGTTFYSTLDLAITNAVAGDYIYLPGGTLPFQYPSTNNYKLLE